MSIGRDHLSRLAIEGDGVVQVYQALEVGVAIGDIALRVVGMGCRTGGGDHDGDGGCCNTIGNKRCISQPRADAESNVTVGDVLSTVNKAFKWEKASVY